MLFNSLHFLVFFIIVTGFYFTIPNKQRWKLLLVSSCYFYIAFVPIYILILGFTIVIDYFSGLLIEKSHGKKKQLFLVLSLVSNIGVLAIFKYYNFINDNFSFLLHGFGLRDPLPYLDILLPIGLSFHTFQAMSYNIEIYRGNQGAEKHFGIFALYVMFYPQLVAGPIERPQNLLHQFREKHIFNVGNFKSGLLLMAWGLFKKVVIADRLSIMVDHSYANYHGISGLSLLIATVCYSFQIYCDFSGYSDMAIGAARIMGFRLMKNFNNPYSSRSIGEFWTRWHISLSTWFRDYLYIPLGGSRVTIPRWYFNLLIVFLISGLWHGANWTFVVWGALHGFYLIFGIATQKQRDKINHAAGITGIKWLYHPIQIITTFCLVTFAWIFFRSPDFKEAAGIIIKIFHSSVFDNISLGLNFPEILFSFLLIIFLTVKENGFLKINTNNKYVFISVFGLLILSCYFFGVFNNKQFIYFQF